MAELIRGQVVVAGDAAGELLVSLDPLSFWGGYDSRTGEIIDRRHPLSGQIVAGRVLALPNTIGSSTTTAVLLEAVRAGTAPAAILTIGIDSFLALASVVSNEMYGRPIPLVSLEQDHFQALLSGTKAHVWADGTIQVLQ
jgi:predicted aconitase with swiveling domain